MVTRRVRSACCYRACCAQRRFLRAQFPEAIIWWRWLLRAYGRLWRGWLFRLARGRRFGRDQHRVAACVCGAAIVGAADGDFWIAGVGRRAVANGSVDCHVAGAALRTGTPRTGGLLSAVAQNTDDPARTATALTETQCSSQAEAALSGLSRCTTLEGMRYRALLSQAERIQLGLLTLSQTTDFRDRCERSYRRFDHHSRCSAERRDLGARSEYRSWRQPRAARLCGLADLGTRLSARANRASARRIQGIFPHPDPGICEFRERGRGASQVERVARSGREAIGHAAGAVKSGSVDRHGQRGAGNNRGTDEPAKSHTGEFTPFLECGNRPRSRVATHTSSRTRAEFGAFAEDVEKTLELLAKMLRGEKVRTKDRPDLREDHQRLLQAGDAQMEQYALVNVEVDRITNSLNMLREQVTKWVRAQKGG